MSGWDTECARRSELDLTSHNTTKSVHQQAVPETTALEPGTTPQTEPTLPHERTNRRNLMTFRGYQRADNPEKSPNYLRAWILAVSGSCLGCGVPFVGRWGRLSVRPLVGGGRHGRRRGGGMVLFAQIDPLLTS